MMKKTIAITALTMMTFTANVKADPCPVLGMLAEKIMQNRQTGHSMNKQLTAMDGMELSDTIKPLVILSYETPKFGTPKYRQEAATEFGNEIMLACYKGEIKL